MKQTFSRFVTAIRPGPGSGFRSTITPQQLILLISILLVILPHFPRLPGWLNLYCLFILGWRYAYDSGRIGLPNTILRIVLTFAPVIILAMSYHTILGKHAGSALLTLMLCLKLMEMRNKRDVMVVIFLAYFSVITGFLFSQSIFTGMYMILVIIALTTTLIAFNHEKQKNNTTLESQLLHLKLATRLLAHAIPLAALLFILFPRVPGPLWSLPEDTANAKTGLSETMEPGRISNLSNSNAVAFRVKFRQTPPDSTKRYWRGPVLGTYTGTSWLISKTGRKTTNNLKYTRYGERTDYTVTLEPHDRNWLFALDLPAILPPNSRLTADLQLLANKTVKDIYRYDMQSYVNYQLNTASRQELDEYLYIPSHSAPRTRELVQQLRLQSSNNAGYVDKVLNYFAVQPFYYSRKPPLLFDDPVDEFIFETQKGFCEHYSSAFTVMMRLAGIPARVVTGYQGGEMNPLSDYMIIRQSDAHAWSEVWLEQRGWIRVDPTSVIPPHRIESTEDLTRIQPEQKVTFLAERSWLTRSLRQAGFVWDAINNRWNQWIIGYNDRKQTDFLASLGLDNLDWQDMAIVLFITLSLALLFIAWLIFQPDRQEIDPAQKAYRRFSKKLEKYGFVRNAGETPLNFYRRITASHQEIASQVENITHLYNQLRYSADADKNLIDKLKSAVKSFSVSSSSSKIQAEKKTN